MMMRWQSAVMAAALAVTSAGVASAEELGSDGMETGAMEVSGEQTQAVEDSGNTLFDYQSEPMKFLSNGGEGYTLQGAIDKSEDPYFNFGGWASLGYTSRSTGMFNDQPSRINNHQSWFWVEKAADGSEGLDYGFRFDGMYGTDAGDTQAFGNRPGNWDYENGFDRGSGYGFAIPQLYAELAYKDFSVIGGHFYTLLGYEVVTAPDNFFFSHAYTMYNSEAFTHTGVLGSYSGIEGLDIYAGWTAGWDTGFDQFDGGSSFLGGFSYSPIDEVSATYITTAGNLGWIGKGYTHSIVIDTTPLEDIGLNYVLQSDYVSVTDYSTIGINQYLMYFPWEEVGVGGRFEWWKAQYAGVGGASYYQATIGTHLKPLPNIIIRPELRWQWSPAAAGNPERNVAGLPVYDSDVIVGLDFIVTF